MPKNEEQVCSFCGLMALGCGVCLIIFIWIFWARGFENIFESTYFVFVYLPLVIIAVTFFFFALVGKKWVREKYPWVCAIILVFFWGASGLHFITKKSNEITKKSNEITKESNEITDKSNEIGDAFGSINALFSGMALAAVAFTILLQKKELQQNREELEGQKNELKAQNATQIQARFENSFFSLLEAQRAIARSITDLEPGTAKINQFSALIHTYEQANFLYSIYLDSTIFEDRIENLSTRLNQTFEARRWALTNYFNTINNGKYDSYFGILYRILKFLDEFSFNKVAEAQIDKIGEIENTDCIDTEVAKIKHNYAGILMSQIGLYEHLAIFYYALAPKNAKLKYLLEEYNMFSSLRPNRIVNHCDLLLYRICAYTSIDEKNSILDSLISKDDGLYTFLFRNEITQNEFYSHEKMREILRIWKDGVLTS